MHVLKRNLVWSSIYLEDPAKYVVMYQKKLNLNW